jgi:hypothetical protein
MTRRRKIVVSLIGAVGLLIVALQLWGPAPEGCDDGPCAGWEWSLVVGLVIGGVAVLAIAIAGAYAIWGVVRLLRRR